MPTTGYKLLDYAIIILIILVISFLVHRILRFFLKRFIKKASEQLNVDPTQYLFLRHSLSLIILLAAVITILFSIPELKQLGLTLFAGAGIFAAILGFASQAAFSNIISGIFIVIFKPFRVGDIVTVSTQYFGTVEDITLRHTVIRDIENKRFILPNTLISSEVVHNFLIGEEEVANQVIFGISYNSDINKAMEIIRDEAEHHPHTIDRRTPEDIQAGRPKVVIRVLEWAESSVNLRATIWTANSTLGFELKTDLFKSVKERFDREGIEIPFPHRTVYLRQEGQDVMDELNG